MHLLLEDDLGNLLGCHASACVACKLGEGIRKQVHDNLGEGREEASLVLRVRRPSDVRKTHQYTCETMLQAF